MDERTFEVELDTPDTAWSLRIERVEVVDKEVWVAARVFRAGSGMAGMAITKQKDSVTLKAPDYPVIYFISGKRWNWGEDDTPENYIFLRPSDRELMKVYKNARKGAEVLWKHKDAKDCECCGE